MNGSTELRRVEVATVLGQEEGHAFQYHPGESDETVWPGSQVEVIEYSFLFIYVVVVVYNPTVRVESDTKGGYCKP